ncbi:MAG: hypothetical protein A2046_14545 [Bacteroidetes bacterium GWA2_30_7]|nr:MAG: hypothetical protein A2046_14545 [Bacteroidetes bacterium GWA2_30_7]
MLTIEKKYTTDDFKKIEEGTFCQLINGEIIMSPSPSTAHQRTLRKIFEQILKYLEINGEVFVAPLDVYLNKENAYQPDIIFVSKEKLDIIKEDGIYGAPDLIIEILSPSNSYYDLKDKKKIYEKYGVKEYWLVDPLDGEATGFKNENEKFIEFYNGTNEFTIKLLNLKIQLNT